MALEMWGGDASWGGMGEGSFTSWGDTILDEILPFHSLGGYIHGQAIPHKPVFVDPEHPLARLPWHEAGPIEVCNLVNLKEGAQLIAEAVGTGDRHPWIASWKVGKGNCLGETQVFGSIGTTNYMLHNFEFFADFRVYLVYIGAGRKVPDDIYQTHRVREEFGLLITERSLLVSLLEFVERFGANTKPLYDRIDDLKSDENEARSLYLGSEFDRCAAKLDEIRAQWLKITNEASELKKAALIWIYITEWLVVTATVLIAGSVVWMIMIGRILYRDVGTTRYLGPEP